MQALKSLFSKREKPSPLPLNSLVVTQEETLAIKIHSTISNMLRSADLGRNFDINKEEDIDIIIAILRKSYRSSQEIAALVRVLDETPFFQETKQKLSSQAYETLMRRIQYEKHAAGDVIFREGDLATKYYYVLRGSVYLLVNKDGIHNEVIRGNQNSQTYNDREETVKQTFPMEIFKIEQRNSFREKQNSNRDLQNPPDQCIPSSRGSSPSAREKPASSHERRYSLIDRSGSNKRDSNLNAGPLQNFRHSLVVDIPKNRLSVPVTLNTSLASSESPKSKTGPETPIDPSNKNAGFSEKIILLEKQAKPISEDKIQKQFPGMKIHKRLSKGTAFGEIALISHASRTGTVVCREETHLLILDRRAYDRLFGEYHHQIYLEKAEFLKSMDLFNDWSKKNISALLYLFEEKQVPMGTVLYKENEPSRTFFLIKEGEIELSQSMRLNFDSSTQNKLYHPLNSFENPQTAPIQQKISKKSPKKRLILAKLGPGSHFGETEILDECDRKTMARVSSLSAHILAIKKEWFLENVKNSWTFDKLCKSHYKRQKWRNKEIETFIRLEADRHDKLRKKSAEIVSKNNLNDRNIIDTPNPKKIRFEAPSIEDIILKPGQEHQQSFPIPTLQKMKTQETALNSTLLPAKTEGDSVYQTQENEQSLPVTKVKSQNARSRRISTLRIGEQISPGVLSEYFESLKIKAMISQNNTELLLKTRDALLHEGSSLNQRKIRFGKSRIRLPEKMFPPTISMTEETSSPDGKLTSGHKRENTISSPVLPKRNHSTQTNELGLTSLQSNHSQKRSLKSLLDTSSPYRFSKQANNLHATLGLGKMEQRDPTFDYKKMKRISHLSQRSLVVSQFIVNPSEASLSNPGVSKSYSMTPNRARSNLTSHSRLENTSVIANPVNIHIQSLIKTRPSTSMRNISFYNMVNKRPKTRMSASDFQKSFNPNTSDFELGT